MHGNRILVRTLLVFAFTAVVWMGMGWRAKSGETATIPWAYTLSSVVLMALIVFYRQRIGRMPAFTNQAHAMRVLTWSCVACVAGGVLALLPR